MSKREFRSLPPKKEAAYPTLDEFDRSSRRSFLARLAGAALGAGALAALASCGGRALGTADTGKRLDGGPTPDPDGLVGPSGAAPMPDAGLDHRRPIEPDSGEILGGEAPLPDAQIDKADLEAPLGKQRMPDARCDDSGCPIP